MRTKVFILGMLLYLPLFGCSAMLSQKASWRFIQEVGGIAVENPLKTQDGYYMPVICDVTGLKKITVKPTLLNSALAYTRSKTTIEDRNVFLTVYYGVVTDDFNKTSCNAVNIGKLNIGKYNVFYRDSEGSENAIGVIEVR